jgi:hypothetical protein
LSEIKKVGFFVPSLEEANDLMGVYDENHNQVLEEEELKNMFFILFSQNATKKANINSSLAKQRHTFLQTKTKDWGYYFTKFYNVYFKKIIINRK